MLKDSKPIVFFDLDGVLVDLYKGIINHYKIDINTNDLKSRHQIWEEVAQRKGMSKSKVSEEVHNFGFDFWSSLPKTDVADEIIEAMKRLDALGAYTMILTATSRDSSSCNGKAIWVKNNLPKSFYSKNKIIFSYQKWACSAPGRYLIDDKQENLDLWSDFGGTAIKCRQPWNFKNWSKEKSLTCAEILSKIDTGKVEND